MTWSVWIGLVSLALVGTTLGQEGQRVNVCYMASWATYRPTPMNWTLEALDPRLCTHVYFAFAKLDESGKLAPADPSDVTTYKALNTMKHGSGDLSFRTSLSVGGWGTNATQIAFSKMVATSASRSRFITSAVTNLRQWGFDGLDIDWEYPTFRGGVPDDALNLVDLLKEIRSAFEALDKPLTLTLAVGVSESVVNVAYNLPAITAQVDWINLMTYDMYMYYPTAFPGHPRPSVTTGFDAPLFVPGTLPTPPTFPYPYYMSVEWAVKFFLSRGAPPHKLALGMGLYGHSWTLTNTTQHGVGAPASGVGTQGKYTRQGGVLAYYEIEAMIADGGTVTFEPPYEVPYVVKGDQWVGYDDITAMVMKCRFLKSKGLRGGMVWSLDLDDFTGSGGKGKYPLLTTIAKELEIIH